MVTPLPWPAQQPVPSTHSTGMDPTEAEPRPVGAVQQVHFLRKPSLETRNPHSNPSEQMFPDWWEQYSRSASSSHALLEHQKDYQPTRYGHPPDGSSTASSPALIKLFWHKQLQHSLGFKTPPDGSCTAGPPPPRTLIGTHVLKPLEIQKITCGEQYSRSTPLYLLPSPTAACP